MTWVEVIIVGCIAAVVISPLISSAGMRKGVRIVATVVLVTVLAWYGVEIVQDLL